MYRGALQLPDGSGIRPLTFVMKGRADRYATLTVATLSDRYRGGGCQLYFYR